jgi:dipeptidyl aminopeptidase/acylaminoacyl peptidase
MSATEMSEDRRSKGMDHSPIGKPSLRVVLVMSLLMGLCLLLLAACGGEESAKGGAGQEHNKKSTSGGTAFTDGLIAFRRYLDLDLTKSAIFTMYPNGTHIRQITHPPKGFSDDFPAWSPDGTKVAFQRGCRPSHCSGSRILVVDVNTGDTHQVTHCIPDGGWTKEHPPLSSAHYCVGDSQPTFSADGKSIAFRRIRGPEEASTRVEGIFMVGLDGSNLHQVTNIQKRGALEFEDSGPGFSPDGDRLVFERSRLADDRTAVFVQSLDSSGSPEDAHQITPWFMGCGDGPEFSPEGDWLLFSCEPEGEGGTSNLYWTHPDGTREDGSTGLDQLTGLIGDPPRRYVGSSFSPEFLGYIPGEGNYVPNDIVAARWPAYGDEGNSDLFGMHVEGGVVPPAGNFTRSETLDDHPSWGTHPPSLKSLCCPRARN